MTTMAQRVASRYLLAATPTPEQVVYTGVFLSKMDRQRLLKAVPAAHPRVLADHMTIRYRSGTSMDPSYLPLGRTVTLKVIGVAQDHRAQVVLVQPQGVQPEEGRTPHITISTLEGVSPVYANALINRGWEPLRGGLLLRGTVGWWDGNRVRTDWL